MKIKLQGYITPITSKKQFEPVVFRGAKWLKKIKLILHRAQEPSGEWIPGKFKVSEISTGCSLSGWERTKKEAKSAARKRLLAAGMSTTMKRIKEIGVANLPKDAQ